MNVAAIWMAYLDYKRATSFVVDVVLIADEIFVDIDLMIHSRIRAFEQKKMENRIEYRCNKSTTSSYYSFLFSYAVGTYRRTNRT